MTDLAKLPISDLTIELLRIHSAVREPRRLKDGAARVVGHLLRPGMAHYLGTVAPFPLHRAVAPIPSLSLRVPALVWMGFHTRA